LLVAIFHRLKQNQRTDDDDAGPAEVDNDWSGRTSGFYGRYFQKEAQKDYRVSSGVLLKIEAGKVYAGNEAPKVPSIEARGLRRPTPLSAEGAEGCGVFGEGCPLPSQLGGLGECRELP